MSDRVSGRFAPFVLLSYIATRMVAATVAALLALASSASAHVTDMSRAPIFFDTDGVSVAMKFNINLERMMAGIPVGAETSTADNAAEYERLRALSPEELKKESAEFVQKFIAGLRFEIDGKPLPMELASEEIEPVVDAATGRRTVFVFRGTLPPDSKVFRFGWDPSFGSLEIRTTAGRSRNIHVETLDNGDWSEPLVIDDLKARTRFDMIADFIHLGFKHIIPLGLDHILFVTGIFLLSTKLRPILMQVTAFTVAHTVTLGLGAAGLIQVPSSIVEPLIAASIVYVAVENILSPTLSPWRPVVVFCFGLLHGLGFASVLMEYQMAPEDFLVGLLSFNLGVEFGQLSVIASCFLLVGIWFGNRPWYRARVVIPGSLLIAAIGAFWFFQRVGLIA